MKRSTSSVEDLMWINTRHPSADEHCPNQQENSKDFREASSSHHQCHHAAKSHSKFRLLPPLFVSFLNREGPEKQLWTEQAMTTKTDFCITNCWRKLKNAHHLPTWRRVLVISFHTEDNIFYPPSQNGIHEILALKFICQNDCWCSIEKLYYHLLCSLPQSNLDSDIYITKDYDIFSSPFDVSVSKMSIRLILARFFPDTQNSCEAWSSHFAKEKVCFPKETPDKSFEAENIFTQEWKMCTLLSLRPMM